MQEHKEVVPDTRSKRPLRGKWKAQQRKPIVRASLITGASINEIAERYGVQANRRPFPIALPSSGNLGPADSFSPPCA